MYIESIELDNFKSFGEKAFIPLFPGFTTVSGPNGSGKSNIIDSLLFALGLSTNKIMRAERLTDLMNNLSGKREMQVSVVLYDEINETQLKVSRRVRLRINGQYESSYSIDSKASTLGEVHDLLARHNISPNAYNVVMQGDVTRIISMSALDRRRIIDELAGVADFDRKIEEARIEIGQATQSLEQQTILLTEFSERLEILQKERDQALKYQDLKKKRNYLERLFRQVRIQELEEKANKIKADIENRIKEKTYLMSSLEEVSNKFAQYDQENTALNEQIDKLNREEKNTLQNQLNYLRESVTKHESGLEFLHKQINDYEKQIERILKESKISERKIIDLDKQAKEIENQEKQIQSQIDSCETKYQIIQNKILAKSQNDNVSTGKVFELQQSLNELNELKANLTTEKALNQQEFQRVSAEIINLKSSLEANLQDYKKVEFTAGGSKSNSLQEKIQSANQYLKKLKDELNDTEQEVRERTSQLYEYQHEASKLEMKKKVAEEQNWGRAIDAVLKSGMNGIHGVLAQLASVPPQYALALETSAGARLKSIVVDNDQVAGQLIDYLRSRNAGRATFLPLNKLKVPYLESLPAEFKSSHSPVIGWAADLIQCDEIYNSAFGYAFGATLVVKDLNGGRNYLGRYRMVTLQGDLLEKTGAMTGGSSLRESGIHFGVEDNAKVQQIQKQIESVSKRITGLQNNIKDLKREVQSSEAEIEVLRKEWATAKANDEIGNRQYTALKSLVETEKNKLISLSQLKENQENKNKEIQSEVLGLEKQINKVSDELAREGSRIKDSGLESLINESQAIEFERKNLEVNLRNLESAKSDFSKGIESFRGSIHKGQEEIELAKAQIIELKGEIEEQEKSLFTQRQTLSEHEKALAEILFHLESLEKQRKDLGKILLNLTAEKTQLSEKLKRFNQDLAELKTKLLDLEERLANLKQETLQQEINELTDQDSIKDEDWKKYTSNLTLEQVRAELDKIEKRMTALEPVNMKAIDEYIEVFEKLNEIKTRCEGLLTEKDEIEKRINNYTDHKLKSFFEAFDDVNKHFKEIFAELSFGQGELNLENKEDPFKGGLIIQARPRNKKMQRLESMSGGEKSLTALSFIFALQWHNPAPFYAFDEVDMFLDGLNAERLARMVKKQSQLAQFIVVSLRKPMIQSSERAIGVFLGKDSFSKVAGMKSKEALIKSAEENEKELVLANHS